MTDLPTRDGFAENLNSAFQVLEGTPQEISLALTHVSELLTSPHQQTFSILFKGPLEWFLPQHIYHLQHARLGELELFLVPVGQEQDGFVYQAVFNHFLP
jgi:hypothetical protein